jgi:hypothetical protein
MPWPAFGIIFHVLFPLMAMSCIRLTGETAAAKGIIHDILKLTGRNTILVLVSILLDSVHPVTNKVSLLLSSSLESQLCNDCALM